MIQVLLLKYWKHLLIIGLLLCLAFSIFNAGSNHGAGVVQGKWDQEKAEHQKAISAEQAKIAILERDHRTEVTRLTHELSKATAAYQVDLAQLAADYRQRLQSSEARADVYRRQAQGDTVDRGSLASHAAKLDAALEEGRALEREYRATLGLRDRQIEALSKQILADRSLLDEK